MNVFEDLVVELKEHNLLEDTVMEALSRDLETIDFGDTVLGAEAPFLRAEADEPAVRHQASHSIPSVSEPLFHKHYSEQAANLRMVEHILAAVERQLQRPHAQAFDELQLNRELHDFRQVHDDPDSEEFITAEQRVRRIMGEWQRSLSRRDDAISVGDLRRYCENCQPALSPQALFSLTRFFYEAPKNEDIRAKFDFVITKLFTRPTANGGRRLICSKQEVEGHLSSRFANWSDGMLQAADSPNRFSYSARCTDFIKEAQRIDRLDDLLKGEFFNRIRKFKADAQDVIFAPDFAAAVIECNIMVGNRFVELVHSEDQHNSFQQVLDEYVTDGQTLLEDASGRSFDLEAILRSEPVEKPAPVREPKRPETSAAAAAAKAPLPAFERAPQQSGGFVSLQVNKWLLAGSTLLIVLSVGLYVWAHYFVDEAPAGEAKVVALENFAFKDYIKTGKISSETFYGVTSPIWDSLPKTKKEEILTKLFQEGKSKGFNKVNLVNGSGTAVAFASEHRIEVAGT